MPAQLDWMVFGEIS